MFHSLQAAWPGCLKIHFVRISYGFRTDFIRIFEYQFNNYMWNVMYNIFVPIKFLVY